MQIKEYISRIIRLQEEKKEIARDIKEVYNQAKGEGYDVKVMKQAIKLLALPEPEREEYTYLLEEYLK